MSEWAPPENCETFYIFVDGKPSEDIAGNESEHIYCMAFVSTVGCVRGVERASLNWLKQYRDFESLAESRNIARLLRAGIERSDGKWARAKPGGRR